MVKKQLLLKCSVLLCALFLGMHAYAQKTGTTITGEVYNSNSEPLTGVAVVEKGKSSGTVTDRNGKFSITVSSPDATLALSSVGYAGAEEKLDGRDRVRITMYETQNTLDDVVVIGYGTAKRGDLTGSVATVSQSAFQDKMATSVEDALRGQVAGVRVLSDNGEPGEDLNIRIRGSGSLNASNSPIYVIDGIVSETLDVASDDIQSMSMLKDASSTAIYGSRGANGVVMVTTKQGQKGKAKVNLQVNFRRKRFKMFIKNGVISEIMRVVCQYRYCSGNFVADERNNQKTKPNHCAYYQNKRNHNRQNVVFYFRTILKKFHDRVYQICYKPTYQER